MGVIESDSEETDHAFAKSRDRLLSLLAAITASVQSRGAADPISGSWAGDMGRDAVIAANADSGATLWEHTTPMTFQSDAAREMGNGPYATPLIVGNRLFTTGVAGRLQCLNKKSGKVLWTQQLWDDHRGSRMMYGYASSPIAFRELVIVPVGGRGKALMAFHQADGKVAWSKSDFGNVYSSPVLINVGGPEQLAVLMDGALIAVNPHNGDLQ